MTDLSRIRKEYEGSELLEETAGDDPIELFRQWFEEAYRVEGDDSNAASLATATPDGRPSARIVLLKEYDRRGFVFYTNYQGRKAKELESNPRAALTFYWPGLARQLRIEGRAEKVSQRQSDRYFHSRPRLSRLAAAASPQSREIDSRKTLEERLRRLEEKYPGDEPIPRPEDWGGYRLRPRRIEFWQGRPGRLHDRIVFERKGKGWRRFRLAP